MTRHFNNPFSDYSSESAEGFLKIESSGIKVAAEYQTRLVDTLDELQATLEHKTSKWRSSSDCSVYTGSAGLALAYLQCYQRRKDIKSLRRAEEIAQHCAAVAAKSGSGKARVTFLCGDGGLLTVAALTAAAAGGAGPLGQPAPYVDRLVSLMERVVPGPADLPDELLYGRAGYLYCLLLLHRLKVCHEQVLPLLPCVVAAILESGKALSARLVLTTQVPLVYEWHDKRYFGAAHGIAGILALLLQALEFLPPRAVDELIVPTLNYLQGELYPSGNLPSSQGSASGDKLVHWCHGAPGATILFAMAHKVLGNSQYLATSRRCAQVVWRRGLLKKGYGLCHGTAGNGYCLLYMYQVTREPEFLYQALQFGAWCQQYGAHGCGVPDRPYSLFEGLAGNLHFLVDLLDVEKASFPGYVLPLVD